MGKRENIQTQGEMSEIKTKEILENIKKLRKSSIILNDAKVDVSPVMELVEKAAKELSNKNYEKALEYSIEAKKVSKEIFGKIVEGG